MLAASRETSNPSSRNGPGGFGTSQSAKTTNVIGASKLTAAQQMMINVPSQGTLMMMTTASSNSVAETEHLMMPPHSTNNIHMLNSNTRQSPTAYYNGAPHTMAHQGVKPSPRIMQSSAANNISGATILGQQKPSPLRKDMITPQSNIHLGGPAGASSTTSSQQAQKGFSNIMMMGSSSSKGYLGTQNKPQLATISSQ